MTRNRIKSHPARSKSSSGPPVGGNDGLLIQELPPKITIIAPEINPAPTETISLRITQPEVVAAQTELNKATIIIQESNATQTEAIRLTVTQPESIGIHSLAHAFNISVTNTETNPAPTEAIKLSLSGSGFNEAKGAFTEVSKTFQRYFASATTDNDSSLTTPANANGENNGTVAIVKTNNAVADLTNPVVLTSTFGTPATGTFTSKKIRVFFDIPIRTTAADTLLLQYKLGAAAAVTIYTHTGTAAVNHATGTFTFGISGLTLAQVQTISLIASYLSSVVAIPETSIRLDAWCVELEQ